MEMLMGRTRMGNQELHALIEGRISYFNTSVPGSGIFLPIHRAEKRASPAISMESFSDTPNTPSYGTLRGLKLQGRTPPTPALPKFSQSMGPGARPPSPQFKPRSRPSLARPESPMRKPPNLQPTPGRQFSMSQRPAVAPRATASPAPGRVNTPKLSASTRGAAPPRPYSRTGSRLGQRNDSISEDGPPTQTRNGHVPSFSHPMRSPSRLNSSGDDGEVLRLQAQLQEKDRQLNDQAATLAEMETSLKEIQSLMPPERPSGSRKNSGIGADGSEDIAQLRQALREKNDKIQSLVTEFDAHRADFRSTIDTLELASGETERVYESKVADLQAELQDLREFSHSREDVETVAEQLKALEELVAELEEGLEDARRGEAEARGEVEFLRGEVERGRSELRREREKAAETMQGADRSGESASKDKELEMKDDEIRALKAILHSMNSGEGAAAGSGRPNSNYGADGEELKRLEASLQELERHNLELEEALQRRTALERQLNSKGSAGENDSRPRQAHSRSPEIKKQNATKNGNVNHNASKWCEACEVEGHDILSCKNFGRHNGHAAHTDDREDEDAYGANVGHDGADESEKHTEHLEPPQAASKDADADKWCALCEKDGHLAFDCPEEQY